MHKLLALMMLAASPLLVSNAYAVDYDDLDAEDDRRKGREGRSKPTDREDIVREIERGLYAKANIGSTSYLMNFGRGVLRSGTTLGLTVGSEFLDQERKSAAWELSFSQGVHNGLPYQQNADGINSGSLPPTAAIQGDTRTFMLTGAVEYSMYASRRIGIGLRAGGGIMFSPLLMDSEAYERKVLSEFGGAAGYVDAVHHTPHPMGLGGPTFEYYTKLSHFSVGADVDAMYAVGFDLGVAATGYMKYTF